ncbi:hypothetical protein AAFC00_003246 [Neodothiora populina]|uniref:tRNA/rRNA methyltransferase SpoU type domain-containing protein n=1 Tax=Neodothiora populina TaxID=2781224 RepID=A0ABR3P9S3_9PEZI
MVQPSRSAQTALANVFLTRIPQAERSNVIRDLATHVDNDTLDLVAALTSECPDEQAHAAVLDFLVRAIESGDFATAASIYLRYSHLEKPLLRRVGNALVLYLTLLLQQPRNEGVIVPTTELSSLVSTVQELGSVDVASHNAADIAHLTAVNLAFLGQVFRASASTSLVVVSHGTFAVIFGLLAATDSVIASAARDSCFAFLAALNNKTVELSSRNDDSTVFDSYMWRYIEILLGQKSRSAYRTTAYAIWLRWLSLSVSEKSSEPAMLTDAYWEYLIDALAGGDTEQRKLCLHILRASLASAQDNISTKNMVLTINESSTGLRSMQAEYERFCTVYETIIVGRYFNQAEECMGDLDVLASSRSLVKKSWLLALLEPALSNVTQDSIRKMLGNWVMSTDIDISGYEVDFARLLQKSFLPWACQGQLFTGSIRGQTKNAQCEHGARLASFFERLLRNHSINEGLNARSCIAKAVLDYLHRNKTRIIPFAAVYVLQGLVDGLKDQSEPCMGAAELEILLTLPTGTAFPEVSNDVVQRCCMELSISVTPEALSSARSADSRLELLENRVAHLSLGPADGDAMAATEWQSLEGAMEDIRSSKHACLAGGRFKGACTSIIKLLEFADPASVDADQLCQILEAVWSELEIQDYPKNILIMLPSVVFHPTCVACSLSNEDVAEMLSSYLTELHSFCTGRVYMWTPLMTTLRAALLNCPSAASRLNIADIIVGTANKPPAAKTEFLLEAAVTQFLPQATYIDYYGSNDEAGFAAFFDLINRLPAIDGDVANETFETLLEPWASQTPPVPIVNKWKTTVQLQIMLILQENLLNTMTIAQARYHMDVLHNMLSLEPLPRYRLLIMWMIARIVIQHPETNDDILRRLSTIDHHSNPKYLASLAKLGLMVACLEDCSEEFAYKLACQLVALSSSSKIIIRHEAQWSFPILWDVAEAQGLVQITENPACASLNDYIRSLERFTTPPTDRQLEMIDPIQGHTLSNLLEGAFMRLDPPAAVLVSGQDVQRLLESDTTSKTLPRALPAGSLPIGVSLTEETVESSKPTVVDSNKQEAQQSARTEAVAALQTKGTAHLAANDTKAEASTRPTDLIVVGSLVDNAYNLGGLSRISEIFGASALHINKPKTVLANKDFVSVAVASQNHLPIHELSVGGVPAFLTEKKLQGYSVVGVEQTDRSVILGDRGTKLPPKTILVMGAEKEGIPAMVLGECDILVEIPQRGVTRSMNVQTACGCVLYEYSRQHHIQ